MGKYYYVSPRNIFARTAEEAEMSADVLATEKAYLKEHQEELAEKYRDRQYLVIRGETVLGAYETYEQGVDEAVENFGKGPFLVRSVYHPEDPEPISIPALSLGILFGDNP